MTIKPGSATGTSKKQPTDLLHTAQLAQGKLLLLKAGIAKGIDGKPTEIKLDAETKSVIVNVLQDLQQLIRALGEQSQSQAKAKAKPKQKQ